MLRDWPPIDVKSPRHIDVVAGDLEAARPGRSEADGIERVRVEGLPPAVDSAGDRVELREIEPRLAADRGEVAADVDVGAVTTIACDMGEMSPPVGFGLKVGSSVPSVATLAIRLRGWPPIEVKSPPR